MAKIHTAWPPEGPDWTAACNPAGNAAGFGGREGGVRILLRPQGRSRHSTVARALCSAHQDRPARSAGRSIASRVRGHRHRSIGRSGPGARRSGGASRRAAGHRDAFSRSISRKIAWPAWSGDATRKAAKSSGSSSRVTRKAPRLCRCRMRRILAAAKVCMTRLRLVHGRNVP